MMRKVVRMLRLVLFGPVLCVIGLELLYRLFEIPLPEWPSYYQEEFWAVVGIWLLFCGLGNAFSLLYMIFFMDGVSRMLLLEQKWPKSYVRLGASWLVLLVATALVKHFHEPVALYIAIAMAGGAIFSSIAPTSLQHLRAAFERTNCIRCGYSFEGIKDSICPECGHERQKKVK